MNQAALAFDTLKDALQRLPGGKQAGAQHEDWRYTSLEPAINISERWLEAGAKRAPAGGLSTAISRITSSLDAEWLVIANGVVEDACLTTLTGIDVERYSGPHSPTKSDRPLADLDAALSQDSLRLMIHSATERPLALLIIDDAALDAGVSQARISITVASGCDAQIVEYHASQGDGDHFANSIISLHIEQAATTHYVRIQEREIGHVQTGHLAIDMSRDSRLEMASFDLGGGLIRNDVDINLSEPGANADFNGLYLAGDGQHIDNHTRVDHRVGPATSSQEYRGILNGRCRCVWNGKAIVHEGADGTDANQANHNLLLSDQAEIDAKPELEIYAEDVKCSHGTTVGQLDETALFYLRTRGIDKSRATQMMTRAFAADLVHRIPIAACRDVVSNLVESRLAELIKDDES